MVNVETLRGNLKHWIGYLGRATGRHWVVLALRCGNMLPLSNRFALFIQDHCVIPDDLQARPEPGEYAIHRKFKRLSPRTAPLYHKFMCSQNSKCL